MSSVSDSTTPPSDGDASKGPLMAGVVGALLLLALIFFALRMYTRLRHDHRRIPLGWDDITITISIVGVSTLLIEPDRHRPRIAWRHELPLEKLFLTSPP
jgi:hypothetical protein